MVGLADHEYMVPVGPPYFFPPYGQFEATRNRIMADEQITVLTPEPDAGETPAPPELTSRQEFRLVGLVIVNRLRFIAILAGVGC